MQVEGVISRIRFRNDENGWSVFVLNTEDGPLTCVGTFFSLKEGEHWKLDGDLVFHPKYGNQFQVDKGERENPKTEDQLVQYMAATLPHVGKKTAHVLYDQYGEDVLDVMEEDPNAFEPIQGIGEKKAEDIRQALAKEKEGRETRIYLQSLDLGPKTSLAIYKHYGNRAQELIEQDPYQLVEDIPGIGFITADQLAAKLGIGKDSIFRTKAAIYYLFSQKMVKEGSSYLTDEDLINRVNRLLGQVPENTKDAVFQLVLDGKLIHKRDEGRTYLTWTYEQEYAIADKLYRMSQDQGEVLEVNEDWVREGLGIELNEDQAKAVRLSASRHVLIITGGPGTGKTTILRAILKIFQDNGLVTYLAAPTGRAAKKMEEVTGFEALTIHRMLGYRGGNNIDVLPTYNAENPLDCQAVIIDEAGMVDLNLMGHLTQALPQDCRLVMVGDSDQLESVGPGQVLQDLIKSQTLPVIQLQQIFRQSEASLIVTNAHRINQGWVPFYNVGGGDFFFLPADSPAGAADLVEDLVARRLPDHYGFHPLQDIQVLSPAKRGPAGVESLNRILQQSLNPRLMGTQEFESGDTNFRLGDKVMQVKNNYQLEWVDQEGNRGQGVYNGDFGFISSIDPEAEEMTVDFDGRKVVYQADTARELEYAYAITVHKAQGSEFPCVVMPLVPGAPLLMTRNILYTGITRAEKICVLVGSLKILHRMVANSRPDSRQTSLDLRLREYFEEGPSIHDFLQKMSHMDPDQEEGEDPDPSA